MQGCSSSGELPVGEEPCFFFAVASGRQHVPSRVRLINEETFKSAVVDIAKCVADANL